MQWPRPAEALSSPINRCATCDSNSSNNLQPSKRSDCCNSNRSNSCLYQRMPVSLLEIYLSFLLTFICFLNTCCSWHQCGHQQHWLPLEHDGCAKCVAVQDKSASGCATESKFCANSDATATQSGTQCALQSSAESRWVVIGSSTRN